jgi:hypothetical protein
LYTLTLAVLVDPEPKAHVLVEHEVEDSTTRYVDVLVATTVGVLDNHSTQEQVNMHSMHCVGGTSVDGDEVEHVLMCNGHVVSRLQRGVLPQCNRQ